MIAPFHVLHVIRLHGVNDRSISTPCRQVNAVPSLFPAGSVHLKPLTGYLVQQYPGGSQGGPVRRPDIFRAVRSLCAPARRGVGWENGAPAKEMCCGLKLVRKK
jgi:hypothetical protein